MLQCKWTIKCSASVFCNQTIDPSMQEEQNQMSLQHMSSWCKNPRQRPEMGLNTQVA